MKGNLNDESIERFSKKYVIEKGLVQYVDHLRELERRKIKRSQSKKRAKEEEHQKVYKDYKWEVLYREGKLKKLKVAEHELKHTQGALKQENVDIVTAHIARSIVHVQSKNTNNNNNNIAYEENDESEDSEEEDDDEDAVIGEIGNDDDKHDDYSSQDGDDGV